MVLPKDLASAPAEFGKAIFGYTRFNVYNPAIQSQLARDKNYRSLTRRIANWNTTRDSTTGWRTPTFTDSTIYGVLVEQSGRILNFLSGTAFDQDAVLKTLDGVNILDQIKDGDKYYEVGAIEEHTDGKKAESFAYRLIHLRLTNVTIRVLIKPYTPLINMVKELAELRLRSQITRSTARMTHHDG